MRSYPGIHLFRGMGKDCNIYVIDSEILVDTGTGQFFADARDEIKKQCDPKTIKIIINTHYHHDHTGGNKKFRDWLGAKLVIHESELGLVEKGETLAERFGSVGKITTMDGTVKEGTVLRTENFSFIVLHTPGHTAGSICLYEPDKKILISGDTIFADSLGRYDLPTGDRLEQKRSLEKLLNYNIQYLLPGHGRSLTSGVSFHIKAMLNRSRVAEFI